MPPAEGAPGASLGLGPGGEFDRIRRFLANAPTSGEGVVIGPGDDAGVLEGGPWAVSSDLAIEEVHFRRDWLSGEEIGYRAAVAALSDLAAMAAEPAALLASLALPEGDAGTGEEIARGIGEACEAYGMAWLGGDLTRSPGPIVIDAIVLGRAPHPVRRSGARAGDEVWVIGLLGGAAASVRLLDAGEVPPSELRAAYARPTARVKEARWLAEHAELRALIDLSDGLGGDAGHLAAASGVRIRLDRESIPVHPKAESALGDPVARRLAVTGGEDYELCCVLPAGVGDDLAPEFRVSFGVPLTRVGWVEAGEGVTIQGPEGEEIVAEGFDHFRGDDQA